MLPTGFTNRYVKIQIKIYVKMLATKLAPSLLKQQTALHLKITQKKIWVSVMYSGRRIGGSTYTATSTARVAVAACVVVVATAAAVVRIVIVVVGAGIVSTAGVPQPGVRTGWKIGIALIRTRIIAQIRDIVATVQAMVRLAGMQIITHSMIYKDYNGKYMFLDLLSVNPPILVYTMLSG